MVQDTKEIGKKINSMARVLKPGLMELAMRETMSKAKSTELVDSHGLTVVLIQENFKKITLKAKVTLTNGLKHYRCI